ncbi:uncharacterized protein L969DRAFT_86684 [Mixia osmundae IAM 14324]|uniref:TRP C-terminal domain-containing protein n=1 Tax=Mixia osmundae (strain CBS 9802 / IAM 14324 / JCM 22182 / KY 12970) TaxID=764103 RepID=G7E9W2_MIXOS|nr:uncharacterized protein L969DRAFT_86684 [Mixia osmundae IAM 14324]KEI40065.1 hypothetical protein L969DRAFT_86684 [Mixia osmundae IAM 14324]GAA99431.1 hypothetical protein E5Q_06130 [Mixia osmundae IAM 14324]
MLAKIISLAALASSAIALQPFEIERQLQKFGASFVEPYASAILAKGSSPFFVDGVVGHTSLGRSMTSNTNNTLFLYGLLAASSPGQLSVTPKIVSAIPSSIAIQGPVASVVFTMGSLVDTVPGALTASFWLRYNDEGLITEYDAAFPNYADLVTAAMPVLAPSMKSNAQNPYATYSDSTHLTAGQLAATICRVQKASCDASVNVSSCALALTQEVGLGNAYHLSADSLWCRYTRLTAVTAEPGLYCSSLLPGSSYECQGSGIMAAFNSSTNFLAPFASEGPNSDHLSQASLEALSALSTTQIYPSTVWAFSINSLIAFASLWLMASITSHAFRRYWSGYATLPYAIQKACVTYVVTIVVTAVVLAVQLAAIRVVRAEYSQFDGQALFGCGMAICALYLFEMIYRPHLRLQLLSHHIFTIFIIMFGALRFQITRDPTTMATSNVWLFQATTEQSVFVGLLAYRMKLRPSTTRRILRFAAIQSMVCKMGSAIYVITLWAVKQRQNTTPFGIAWSVILVMIVSSLVYVQIWGAHVLLKIANTVEQRYNHAQIMSDLAAEELIQRDIGLHQTPDERSQGSCSEETDETFEKTNSLEDVPVLPRF